MEINSTYSDSEKKKIGTLFILYALLIIVLSVISTVQAITGRIYSQALCLYFPVTIGLILWTPLLFLLRGRTRIATIFQVVFIGANLLLGTELQLTHILLILFFALPSWFILVHSPELPFLKIPAALLAGSYILFSLILFSILEHNLHVIFRILFRLSDLAQLIAGGVMIQKVAQWVCGTLSVEETEDYFPEETEEEPENIQSGGV